MLGPSARINVTCLSGTKQGTKKQKGKKGRKIGGNGCGLVAKLCPTLATPWTVACQAHLSMGFSRQEYWSGLPFPSPWDLPNPGIEPRSPALKADSLPCGAVRGFTKIIC